MDHRELRCVGPCGQPKAHTSHRKPDHEFGLARVGGEDRGVVALEPARGDRTQREERVVVPVPAQRAVDAGLLATAELLGAPGRADAAIRSRQDRHRVAGRPQAGHCGLPHALVPTRVVRRVAVADGQDAHEGSHATPGPAAARRPGR